MVFIPHTDEERQEMLASIGAERGEEHAALRIEALFHDIPEKYRYPHLDLPEPLSEMEALQDVTTVAQREIRVVRNRFIFAAAIAALIMVLGWGPAFMGKPYLLWALATPVQFWAGLRFYRGAWGALKHKTADMNTLIAMGTSAAYLYSVVAVLFPGLFASTQVEPGLYFDTSAMIIALILLGRFLEARAKGQTSKAIKL